jgi:hypothetical protein
MLPTNLRERVDLFVSFGRLRFRECKGHWSAGPCSRRAITDGKSPSSIERMLRLSTGRNGRVLNATCSVLSAGALQNLEHSSCCISHFSLSEHFSHRSLLSSLLMIGRISPPKYAFAIMPRAVAPTTWVWERLSTNADSIPALSHRCLAV